jgi:hypothetical protein
MAGEILLINPRKRRRKSRGRKRNPAYVMNKSRRRRRGRKSYRRNPSSRSVGRSFGGIARGFVPQIVNAAKGAGGAILTDAAFTYIPLPVALKTGPLGIASRALTAFLVSYLAGFAVGGRMAGNFLEGALTVQAYGVLKPLVAGFIPLAGSEIEGLGYYSPGMILQDDLSPLTDLNAGTPLQAYISGMSGLGEGGVYDESIEAYIS